MQKVLLLALLSQGFCVSCYTADSVFEEIKELMGGFEKRFKAVEEYMNNFPEYETVGDGKVADKAVPKKKIMEISSDDSFVTVKLNLGDLDYDKIDIEVDGDSLTGSVPAKDGNANFYVQNGRIFGLSFKRELKNEQKDEMNAKDNGDRKEYQSIEVSESTKVESLPYQVCDLEKMVANYKDGMLELKLPKVPQKKGKKINVITAS